jgi:hypothetical protein
MKRQKELSGIDAKVTKDKALVQSFLDDYPKYLRSARWKRIRDRIWERDAKCCLRCGGAATAVHHRSYADEVMLGRDDTYLASICEGCHNIIHFDDSGRKRFSEDPEIDGLLLQKDHRTEFPTPTIDLRKKRYTEYPEGWDRMNAVQRAGYGNEERRLLYIARLQRGKSKGASIYRKWLNELGMDDHAIDTAIASRTEKGVRARLHDPNLN